MFNIVWILYFIYSTYNNKHIENTIIERYLMCTKSVTKMKKIVLNLVTHRNYKFTTYVVYIINVKKTYRFMRPLKKCLKYNLII